MQYTLSEQESYFLSLIKRTPHIEELMERLRMKGFPSTVQGKKGTRYQKCRRLYDKLHQHFFSYDETRKDELKKVFHNSSNGLAAELLFSSPTPLVDEIIDEMRSNKFQIKPMPPTQENMMRIRNCLKIGNFTKLESLIYCLAAYSAGFIEYQSFKEQKVDIIKYRDELKRILLEERDWSDKTLLHIAIDAKTTKCVDVILKLAYEARAKEELLDAEDTFGETALHRAIKKQNVPMTKKLILEGSNLLSRNTLDEHPLQLIFLRLPSIIPFIMDLSVSYSGDIYNTETFCMNIDFTPIITPIEISHTKTKELLKMKKKMKTNPTFLKHIRPRRVLRTAIKTDSGDNELELLEQLKGDPENPEELQLGYSFRQHQTEARIVSLSTSERLKASENIEMTSLTFLVYNNTQASSEILSHPVAQTYLDLKWSVMKRFLLTVNTGLRICIHSLYVYLLMLIYFNECPHSDSKSRTKCTWSLPTQIIVPIVITLNFLFTVQEILTVLEVRKIGIFVRFTFKVLLHLIFICMVVTTTIPPMFQEYLYAAQYSLATIGVLVGAGLILQAIGNSNFDFCIHSIYIHVYGKVMMRFLTVMATFFPLVASFAIVFSIIFPKVEEFSGFWRSLLRLAIMMQGEFDYQDINRNSTLVVGDVNESNQWLFWTGQISFGLFGCILTLVLIDVFLGYTVSDIKELKSEAEFVSRCNQIRQIFVAERIFSKLMSNKLIGRILRALKFQDDHCNIISSQSKRKFRYNQMILFEHVPLARRSAFTEILVDSM